MNIKLSKNQILICLIFSIFSNQFCISKKFDNEKIPLRIYDLMAQEQEQHAKRLKELRIKNQAKEEIKQLNKKLRRTCKVPKKIEKFVREIAKEHLDKKVNIQAQHFQNPFNTTTTIYNNEAIISISIKSIRPLIQCIDKTIKGINYQDFKIESKDLLHIFRQSILHEIGHIKLGHIRLLNKPKNQSPYDKITNYCKKIPGISLILKRVTQIQNLKQEIEADLFASKNAQSIEELEAKKNDFDLQDIIYPISTMHIILQPTCEHPPNWLRKLILEKEIQKRQQKPIK